MKVEFLIYIHSRNKATDRPIEPAFKLDEIDKIIINARSKQKPTSFRALAKETGLAKTTMIERRNKLREQGITLN